MESKLLADDQLSLESRLKILGKAAVPNWLIWVRQAVFEEVWFPSPRCLPNAWVIACTTMSEASGTPGEAYRIAYLMANDLEGWFPIPGPDEHGGEVVLWKSFRPASRATLYEPPMPAAELDRHRSRLRESEAYWRKFAVLRADEPPPKLLVPPPPKRGLLAWLSGR